MLYWSVCVHVHVGVQTKSEASTLRAPEQHYRVEERWGGGRYTGTEPTQGQGGRTQPGETHS